VEVADRTDTDTPKVQEEAGKAYPDAKMINLTACDHK